MGGASQVYPQMFTAISVPLPKSSSSRPVRRVTSLRVTSGAAVDTAPPKPGIASPRRNPPCLTEVHLELFGFRGGLGKPRRS